MAAPKKLKKVKIEFLKSPTGAFKMAYSRGDVATVSDELANVLIDAEFAKKVK